MKQLKHKVYPFLAGTAMGLFGYRATVGNMQRKTTDKIDDDLSKMTEFYHILLQWLRVRQEGRTLENYFLRKNCHNVAVYGMKELGEALVEELRDSSVKVLYGVDRDADSIYAAVDMYRPDEELAPVDVLVVTAVHYFDAIEREMKQKFSCPIVSIEDVVWEA